jgi:GNAT superfamily N-acetyltransferase
MIVRELNRKEEMLAQLEVMQELYPSLTADAYSSDLENMLPNNRYGQVAVFDGEKCLGIAGFWIGTKLWCGKYLEIDNMVVSAKHRSQGAGKMLFSYLKNKANEEGCSMLALDSYTANFKAHKFFYNEDFGPKGFHFIHVINQEQLR